ncbi:hypothetical protein IJG78_02420 [Candidatus Saccharibacteria bacterium]|nr:hypothetical protein [Candidatus Saccharibacteria bacterium]
MLINATKLVNCSVLSLHVGGKIAETTGLIIDPNDLKVAGFDLVGPDVGGENGTVLQPKDIREFSEIGMVVDSIDEFVKPEDVVKLDEVIKLNFTLEGIKVETKKGTKLGKVTGYTVNTENFLVQQLVVGRPFMKAFLDPELLIGRSEVVEVNDDKIIVKDEEDKIRKNAMTEDFVPNFVNPFRDVRLAPEPELSQADSQTLDELDKQ